ncbi:hypothetical protein [uncultured Roseobacter sp.]|uniref:hypothetical protein n=1 Tax=uncultured Roseobacter sp. TaxID=114847 RepID=UPI002625B29E|nr:hypothetical protein [uncultured Roseobacter sp.]
MINPRTLLASARRMQLVMSCMVGLFLVGSATLIAVVIATPGVIGAHLAQVSGFANGPLEPWQTVALACIGLVHMALWLAVLTGARRVFGQIAQGNPEGAATTARQLSYGLWAMLGWGLVSQMIVSVVATWGYPPGQRALALGIGTPEISVALSALIAGFLARAFALGAELWRDHQAVV